MAVDFADVTDVAIPEGDVERITETATGNVLWEKNLAPNAEWISRTLSTEYGVHNLSFDMNPIIQCLSKDTFKTYTWTITLRMGVSPQTGLQYKPNAYSFTDLILSKNTKPVTWERAFDHISFINRDNLIAVYMSTSRILSISDDGLMDLFYCDALSSEFKGYWISDTNNQRNTASTGMEATIKVNNPVSEDKARIIHSDSRKEYLVTGISGGAFTIPKRLSGRTTQSKYSGKNITGACWCSRDNLYYGVLNSTNSLEKRYISYSSDGYTWTDTTVFPSNTTAFGVVDMSTSKRLVAFSSDRAKIALSTNGKTWTLKDTPFTSVAGYAYSPEYDLLCVADNSGKTYLTKNLEHWQKIEAPANVKFKDFVHLGHGFFAGIAYKADRVYILTTQNPFQ